MKFAECFKCGKVKLASVNRKVDNLTVKDVEMKQMGYGKNRGLFRCKDCKEEIKFKNDDLSSLGGWTSTKDLIKHYGRKEID